MHNIIIDEIKKKCQVTTSKGTTSTKENRARKATVGKEAETRKRKLLEAAKENIPKKTRTELMTSMEKEVVSINHYMDCNCVLITCNLCMYI